MESYVNLIKVVGSFHDVCTTTVLLGMSAKNSYYCDLWCSWLGKTGNCFSPPVHVQHLLAFCKLLVGIVLSDQYAFDFSMFLELCVCVIFSNRGD